MDELLKCRADVDAETRSGATAAVLAAESEHWDILEMLLQKRSCDEENALSLFAQKAKATKQLFVSLVESDAPEAVTLLHMWPRDCKQYDEESGRAVAVKRSKLTPHERLRVVLAPRYKKEGDVEVVHKCNVNLEKQNLFDFPQKQTTLKVLPGLTGTDACSLEVLRAVVHTTNLAIFETDAVESVVIAAWQQARADTACEIGCSLILLSMMCCATYASHNEVDWESACLTAVWIFHIKKSLEELCQYGAQLFGCSSSSSSIRSSSRGCCDCSMFWQRFWHLLDFDNLADVVYLSLGWTAILVQLLDSDSRAYKPWMGIFAAMVWLRALYSLRGESWLGPHLLPVLAAVRESNGFLFIVSVCTLAATHAHYDLETTWLDSNQPWALYVSFMRVMRLAFLGDFDLFEFEGSDITYERANETQSWKPVEPTPGQNYILTHGLFYVISWGIAILLMNILIAVLSESYTRHRSKRSTLLLHARAKMVLELKVRPWRLFASCRGGRPDDPDVPNQHVGQSNCHETVVECGGKAQGPAQSQGGDDFHGVQPRLKDSHHQEAKGKIPAGPGGDTKQACCCPFLEAAMFISLGPFFCLSGFKGTQEFRCYLEHQKKQYRLQCVLSVLLVCSAPLVWAGFLLFSISRLVLLSQGTLHVIATSIGWHGWHGDHHGFVTPSNCQIWLLLDSSGSQQSVDLHEDLKRDLQDMKQQMSKLQSSFNKLMLQVGATSAKSADRATTNEVPVGKTLSMPTTTKHLCSKN